MTSLCQRLDVFNILNFKLADTAYEEPMILRGSTVLYFSHKEEQRLRMQ